MDVLSDLRIAARGLMRSKGFAIAGAITLALGIAATTTIFSVVYGVLLRPLPYRDADRLVVIQGEKAYSTGPRIMNFSAPELEPFVASAKAFSSIAFSGRSFLSLRNDSGVRGVPVATVSGEFFQTLGTNPIVGRVIGDEKEPVVVISERFWRQVFASSPDVLGQSVTLADGPTIERTYTIVGVMPAEFQVPDPRLDVWRTLAFARATGDGRIRELGVGGHQIYARLKEGVSLEAARADASATVDRVLKPHFTNSRIDMYAKTTPLSEFVRGTIGPALWVLMGAVTLVLLVACANVANLILARQTSRAREISMRLALGAPRGRLIACLMTEGAMLAVAGAVAGVAMAFGAIALLQYMEPSQVTRLDAVAVDLPVIVFASTVTMASALLASLSPAVLATRTDAASALRAGTRGVAAPGMVRWLRSALVVAEIATSIILIVGAALLARSLSALLNTDIGVNTENVIAANLDMAPRPGQPSDEARRRQIANDLQARLAALPTVSAVGIGSAVPPSLEQMRVSFILSNGKSSDSHMVTMVPASPGYFTALQIRLVAGRLFEDRDDALAEPVVIVSREAARRFFGNDDPLGRTLPLMGKQVTIVGVVDNVKYTGIASGPESVLYAPYAQQPVMMSVLFARTTGDPGQTAADIRRLIMSYDSAIGVPRLWTLNQWIADATAQPRFRTILLSSIAVITLCLAIIGLYGVIAYATSQRTSEIGLRIAIGAQRGDVIRLVLSEGARLAGAGIILGLAGSYWATQLLSSFLYGVTATDPAAFGAAAITLFFVALLATYLPARRAARIDPMTALRTE
ncbi:MAG: ABC transporter permease [Cyanobacteria bacterium]|nr:ABC transporter permease [Cyanobacteriota bacterium]